MRVQLALVLICGAATSYAGLLGAGTGHGSCAAFPFRADDLDHVGGCPRYAECCTEFGYCHSKDSWEAGYFRDCNGASNGQPLPGSVIRLEAAQSAKGESQVTAQVLGISQEIWQSQVQKAVSILTSSTSSSSSSSSSSSGQSSFTGSSISSGSSGSFSSSDLVQQIILAIQPQIAQIVQSAVSTQSTVTSELVSNDISSVNNQESFQSFSGSSQFGSSGSSQLGSSGSSQFGSSGSSQFGSTGSSQLGSSGSSQFGSSGSSQLGSSGSSQFGSSGSSQLGTSGSSQFGSSGGSQFGSGSRFDATNDISSTLNQESQTLNTNSQLVNSLDVSQLVSLVLAALTPQITAAVQSAAV